MTGHGPLVAAGLLIGAWVLAGCSNDEPPALPGGAPTGAAVTAVPVPGRDGPAPEVVNTTAAGLEVPWGLAFLPDGSALVTERDSGRVLSIREGTVSEVGNVVETAAQGEAGLLGVAVSPSFATDAQVFLYVTTAQDNRILRTTYDGQRLGEVEVILDGIPNGFIHDGGRLVFGPDGFLYVSTGEIGEPELAQDLDSLGGKILRITTDGDPAPGNPFKDSPIWTWGHRNVQGLAFDDRGRLWASEFGSSEYDELNLIVKGANYGWPLFEGTGGNGDYAEPEVVWQTSEASPSGLAFAEGHLWLGALKGERLWRISVEGERASDPVDFFVGNYGRLRTVVVAPGGNLWVTTSNRDGRGDPAADDDRILEITPG